MTWDPVLDADIAIGNPVVGGPDTGFGSKVKGNLEHLYSQTIQQGFPPNGSFEIDSDEDGVPDLWTRSLYPGGSGVFETTNPAHGAQAYKFIHPGGSGNGGGYLTSDYIEISSVLEYLLSFILWASVAGMKNIVRIEYFTAAKASISTEDLYSSTSNPTSATSFIYLLTIPATARYLKIILIGGYTDTDVAGNIFFDGVALDCCIPYAIGDCEISCSVNAETTTSTSPVMKKEWRIGKGGALRVKWAMQGDGTYEAHCRVYVNGSPVGVQKNRTTASYYGMEDDITGLNAGDLVQIYGWVASGGTCYIKSAFLCASQYSETFVRQDGARGSIT